MRTIPICGALVALVLGLAACGEPAASTSGDDRLAVVATTTILADVVGDVVGDAGSVGGLLPVGADAHGFTPSAAQVRALRDADLVVVNGLGLEEGLEDAVAAAREEGARIFTATDHVDLIDEDPHFWTDPARMIDVVEALGAQLEEIDGSGGWPDRAARVAAGLADLDSQIRQVLAPIAEQDRVLVTSHEALGYFAQAYDFTVLATVIPGTSTLAEPSPRDLQEVVDAVAQAGVPAIFAETSASSQLAEAVAAEVGHDVDVVTLYTESLSAADGPAATYEDLLLFDARAIAEALG